MIPIFVSYYWGNYESKAQTLRNKLDYFKIDHDIQYINFNVKDYQSNINYKPTFIKKMIKKHKRPVVYLDVDLTIKKYPKLLDTDYFDIQCINWNNYKEVMGYIDPYILETAGGLFYFNNSKQALKLVSQWESWLQGKYKGKSDDRVFSMMFYDTMAIKWCRCNWLPMTYLYIPEHYHSAERDRQAIIVHKGDLTPEPKIARIPKDYSIHKKTKNRHLISYSLNKTKVYPNTVILQNNQIKQIKSIESIKSKNHKHYDVYHHNSTYIIQPNVYTSKLLKNFDKYFYKTDIPIKIRHN